jgi:hypothetical protein
MASITGLQSGNFSDIDVTYTIAINGDIGQNGQVLSSDGTFALWINGSALPREDLTAADTTITISGDGTYDGQVARTIQTNKVPNLLTFATDGTGSRTGTFDGSSAITIDNRDTDTTYTATQPIAITGTNIELQYDNDTIILDGGDIAVAKVPNLLTFTGYDTGTFDGSSALTINLVDTNTTYTAGTNRNLLGTTFNLNASLTSIDSITMTSTASAGGTSLTGNNYPAAGYQTPMTYFNLLSSTNIISPYFLHDTYDPVTADTDSLTTSYTNIFSNNLKNSFTAQFTSCCIELLTYNYSISGNRWLYLQLGDNTGTEWSSGATADGGGTGTGTRITARTIQYTDETDKVPVRQTWFLQGLTVGTSYTINPMAKTSSTLNYIYAGGDYPASILRGYYLPETGV